MSSIYIPGLHEQHPTYAISPKITASLIHEALGHLAEADSALACAHQSPFLRLPPLSNKITVVDYAHTAFGKPCPLPIYIDDEGTTAKDVCIIKDGQRANYMTNLYTAATLSIPPTGNARSASPNSEIMIRMRNTALLPGPDTPAEIISSIQNGYYLVEPGNCYGDINGDFCCELKEGYRIINGQIRERVLNHMLFGQVASFLKSITMVANDFQWHVDECTKWDTIKVGQGAPTIKACLKIVGGL